MLIKQSDHFYGLKIPPTLKVVYVSGKGLALFAHKEFKKGERIVPLRGVLVDAAHASPEAIQMTDKQFIDTEHYVPEDFINHSCAPNTWCDMRKRWFVAIKDIPKNEELTFNYLTTEWDMKKMGTDFKCVCGSKNCFGNIRGFKYLTRAEKLKLKSLLSPLLQGKIGV